MKREIYDDDHEAFRDSVTRSWTGRSCRTRGATPTAKALPREFWLAAGKQGFLGLEIPEEYGGSEAGDYRFNAVLTEELAKVNMALPSCLGIHADIVAPYLVAPDHRRAEAALAAAASAPASCSRRSA